nr:uncharacterized protein LOC113817941 [Penaeus vannamei]
MGPTDGDVLLTPGVSEALTIPHSVTTVKERHCHVWAVNPSSRPLILHNGTRLASTPPQEPVARTSNNPVEEGSWEDDVPEEYEWEEDEFDNFYGVQDFGYEDDLDVCDAELPPSLAIAAIEAVESLASKAEGTRNEDLAPDLSHLGDAQRLELTQVLSRYQELFDGDEETVGCHRAFYLTLVKSSSSREEKGGTLRFCVDYRGLNAVTKRDTYPLPHISEMIDELGTMNIFTTLDARAAYWSVEVEELDRPKTAFSDGYRLFHFRRLPFGLSTAPTHSNAQ